MLSRSDASWTTAIGAVRPWRREEDRLGYPWCVAPGSTQPVANARKNIFQGNACGYFFTGNSLVVFVTGNSAAVFVTGCALGAFLSVWLL